MLNITYAAGDSELAAALQKGLAEAGLRLENNILLVLISPESSVDPAVQKAISEAAEQGERIVPVLVGDAPLPAAIAHLRPLDFRVSYSVQRLVQRLMAEDMADRRRRNRRALLALLLLVLLLASISIWALTTGLIAFPRREYETVDTALAVTANYFLRPTLEGWQPRTTQDALDFPATAAAAPTRVRPYLVMTATALPSQPEGD